MTSLLSRSVTLLLLLMLILLLLLLVLLQPSFRLNPFPNKPWFLRVCSISLLKTLWEKEKLLVTSNFSFSQCVSTFLDNFFSFSSNLKLLSANCMSFEEFKICCLGKVYHYMLLLLILLMFLLLQLLQLLFLLL